MKIVSGTPKTYSATADSGKVITSRFCGDCGTTLFRTSETFGGNVMIKVGVMDDVQAFDHAKPAVELYCRQRVAWVPGVEGAKQMQALT